MADEDLSLNEDQLLDNFDDANGDLLEVKGLIKANLAIVHEFHHFEIKITFRRILGCR